MSDIHEGKSGVLIPAETAKSLMEGIRQMRAIYADTTRSEWWEADDLAKDISEKLGKIIENQEDALTVDHGRSHEKGLLNSKGHIVLAHFGNNALIFEGEDSPRPYVCAWEYNDETGEYSDGTCFCDPGRAWNLINPEIIEDATIHWERRDLIAALEDYGIEPSNANVQILLNDMYNMRFWRESAIQAGCEEIERSIAKCDALWEQRPAHIKEKDGYSLSSEQRDMSLGKEGLAQENPLHREFPER